MLQITDCFGNSTFKDSGRRARKRVLLLLFVKRLISHGGSFSATCTIVAHL